MKNRYVNTLEEYQHELSNLTFDTKALEKNRANIEDLSIEDTTGLVYMKGQFKILEDVINQLVSFDK